MNRQTDADDKTELLEIYKLHANLADHVSQRREGANRLYASLLTGLFIAIAALIRFGIDVLVSLPVILISGGVLGLGLCVSWYFILRSYKQLNRGKFAAMNALEAQLAFPFFRLAWESIEQGKNFKKYWKLTDAETILPILFGFAYIALAIVGFFSI